MPTIFIANLSLLTLLTFQFAFVFSFDGSIKFDTDKDLTSELDLTCSTGDIHEWRTTHHASMTWPPDINGGWSTWANVGGCSVSCGGGTQHRTRACDNPPKSGTGASCSGLSTDDTQTCNTAACPINGAWSTWGSWASCSVTCGGGTQQRTKTCTSPAPAHGGVACSGSDTESQACNSASCPAINGGWTTWGSWTSCTATCGGGTQARARGCTNPAPAHGGSDCSGSGCDSQPCNSAAC